MSNDVTGLAVALTATVRARANQLSRDLQKSSRKHDKAAAALTETRRAYAKAADEYRTLYDQALGIWTVDELTAAGAKPPPPDPKVRAHTTPATTAAST